MKSGCGKSSGFTLVELVLVAVVIAIMVGMVAPSFRGFVSGRRSADTADQLVTLTRWAHAQAISEGTIYRLNIDPQAHTYWVSTQDGAGEHIIQTSSGRIFDLPENVQLQTDIAKENGRILIRFYPNGRTTSGSLHLADGQETIDVSCPSAAESYAVAPRKGGGL